MSERTPLLVEGGQNRRYAWADGDASSDSADAGISFHGVWYSVVSRHRPPCCPGSSVTRLDILRDVSGCLPPGMNALLGPTGSGKTTLLDCLAGRKDPSRMRGTVLVHGRRQPANFRCVSGYVVQDDALMGTLSVRENLAFSASLRLGDAVSRSQRNQIVDDVIRQLGLSRVSENRIGTQLTRGVSGGERKRTSIGMELVIRPDVLFLDEPTTGLDASTAYSVMQLLRELSREGRTIVFSIHQPRFSIFEQFDTLSLLCGGQLAYQGPADGALGHFESLGFTCGQFNNPLDLFMDVVNGDVKSSLMEAPSSVVDAFRNSTVGKEAAQAGRRRLEGFHQRQMASGASGSDDPVSYRSSFGLQLRAVAWRAWLNLARTPQAVPVQMLVNVVFAVVVGLIYLQLSDDLVSGVQNRIGVFFFVTMSSVFSNMGAIELFLQERELFAHENSSGYYRVSVYFLAKVFCDLLPLRLLPLLVYAPTTYFMIGLQPDFFKFLFYTLNIFVTSMAGSAVAFFIGATAPVFAVGSAMLAMTFVFMMVFAGLLVNLDSMGDWLNWLRYLSIFRYSLNGLSINELKDKIFCDANRTVCKPAGNMYLDNQGVPYQTDFDLWVNEIALSVFVVVFLCLAYVQLRRLNKYK